MTALQSGPVPLVIALHGAGDTGSNFITATGLKTEASNRGWILAAPDGYPGEGGIRAWSLNTQEGWPGTDGNSNSLLNDIKLVLKVISETGALYNLNTKKHYCCGFSRGAGFTGIIVQASGNPGVFQGSFNSPFAAYGICAGYDAFGEQVNLANTTPKRPVWLIHGTADQAVPYSQGQSFANALQAAGFPTTFTTVNNAPHNWLWAPQFGHSNTELFDFFDQNPLP